MCICRRKRIWWIPTWKSFRCNVWPLGLIQRGIACDAVIDP